MANSALLWPFIASYEGGFVNDPQDAGGATNRGITLSTWKTYGRDKDGDGDIDEADLRMMTAAEAEDIFRRRYWNACRADEIACQSVANALVDWLWCSGKPAIMAVQRAAGAKADGIIGPITIAAVNAMPGLTLFNRIQAARLAFLTEICQKRPANRKFLRGWQLRMEAIRYGSLTLSDRRHTVIQCP